jgi:hypothetical protein
LFFFSPLSGPSFRVFFSLVCCQETENFISHLLRWSGATTP